MVFLRTWNFFVCLRCLPMENPATLPTYLPTEMLSGGWHMWTAHVLATAMKNKKSSKHNATHVSKWACGSWNDWTASLVGIKVATLSEHDNYRWLTIQQHRSILKAFLSTIPWYLLVIHLVWRVHSKLKCQPKITNGWILEVIGNQIFSNAKLANLEKHHVPQGYLKVK